MSVVRFGAVGGNTDQSGREEKMIGLVVTSKRKGREKEKNNGYENRHGQSEKGEKIGSYV